MSGSGGSFARSSFLSMPGFSGRTRVGPSFVLTVFVLSTAIAGNSIGGRSVSSGFVAGVARRSPSGPSLLVGIAMPGADTSAFTGTTGPVANGDSSLTDGGRNGGCSSFALTTAGVSAFTVPSVAVKCLYPYAPPPSAIPDPPRMSASFRCRHTLPHRPLTCAGVGTPAAAASTSAAFGASIFVSKGLPPMPASLRHVASHFEPAGCPALRRRPLARASSSLAPRPHGPGRRASLAGPPASGS